MGIRRHEDKTQHRHIEAHRSEWCEKFHMRCSSFIAIVVGLFSKAPQLSFAKRTSTQFFNISNVGAQSKIDNHIIKLTAVFSVCYQIVA